VPGYVSINICSRFVGIKIGDLAWVEKVVLSYVASLGVFFIAFLPFGIPLSADTVISVLTAPVAFLLLIVTVLFGFLLTGVYWLFARFMEIASNFAARVQSRVGLDTRKFGAATAYFLNLMWETRELNDLIIETQSNRTFRGQLGAISVEPTMDVLLVSRSAQEPLQELDSRGTWVPLTQWSILVPEGNIRTVHAVRV
jgi:hypothetical protein